MNIQKFKIRDIAIAFLFFTSIVMMTAGCDLLRDQPQNPTSMAEPGQETDFHLEAELTIPESVPLCEPIELEFKVTNQSDQAVYLLTWYTPLEGIMGNIFRVTYDEWELPYLGPLVMRAAPLADQYVMLSAGESVTNVVDLSTVYDFSEVGIYKVAYKSPTISHVVTDTTEFATSVDALGPVQIYSQPVEVEITASESGEINCSANLEVPSAAYDQESVLDSPQVTITGIVKEVSPSALIIWLQDDVGGFSTIALSTESMVTTASGKPIGLNQIQQGLTVKASGKPGENHALLADSVLVVPPQEKFD